MRTRPPLTVRSGPEAEPLAAGGGIRPRTERAELRAVPRVGTSVVDATVLGLPAGGVVVVPASTRGRIGSGSSTASDTESGHPHSASATKLIPTQSRSPMLLTRSSTLPMADKADNGSFLTLSDPLQFDGFLQGPRHSC